MEEYSVKKLYPLIFAALPWVVSAVQASDPAVDSSVKVDHTALLGAWAMAPLRNGIANVAEYLSDGTVALHSFNCAEPNVQGEIEVSKYTLAHDGTSIHIESPKDTFDLEVLSLTPTAMRLSMTLSGYPLIFSYQKVQKIAPLCASYVVDTAEEARKSSYQSKDFVPAPTVPPHADLSRYVGQWANEHGDVQLEVRREKGGDAYLYRSNSENWVYLFNGVSWKSDGLHFTAFAYSNKPDLYDHPYHKSKTPNVIAINEDGTLKQITFIKGTHRFESTLIRKNDK
ncbi:hypothetical protein D3C76_855050 [compost metagenome]